MGRKRLGLDIGTSCLKAVVVEETLRGLRVSQCREVSFRLGPDPMERREAFAEALVRLLPETDLESFEVITAIPSHQVSWHRLELPFGRSRQVARVIRYEVAQNVPYDLEDVVTDFFIPTMDRHGGAVVRAVCVARERLLAYRNLLQEVGIVPAEITAEALATYYSYLAQEPAPPEGTVGLLDIGASKTTVCIVRGGSFFAASSIYKGGDWVTRRLADDLGISFEQAEEMKLHADLAHQPAVDHAYEDFLSSLGDSIEHCLVAHTSPHGGPEDVAEIVVGGGCARAARVLSFLGKRLGAPVRLANPFEGLATALFVPAHVAGPLCHIATGLALTPSYRGKARIDLQRATLRKQEPRRGLRNKMAPAAVAVVVLLAVAMGSFYYKLYSKERRYRLLTEQVNALFSSTFSDVPVVVDARKQMASQVERVGAELKGLGGLSVSKPKLDLLRELSGLVPQGTDLLIVELSLENGRLRLQGETVSFDAVDSLRARLTESEYFGDAVIDAANTNKRTGGITFTISAAY